MNDMTISESYVNGQRVIWLQFRGAVWGWVQLGEHCGEYKKPKEKP